MTVQQEVSAFQNGDREFLSDVLSACKRVVGRNPNFGVEELEDIAIEAAERAASKLTDFRGQSSLKTWIVAFAKMIALEHLRRRRTSPIDDPLDPSDVAAVGNEEDALLDRMVLDEIIGKSDDVGRLVIELTIDGYSATEIGSRVGRTANAIILLRRRLLAELHDLCQEMED